MIVRLVWTALVVSSFCAAWNCDSRCPEYDECVKEECERGNLQYCRRFLVLEGDANGTPKQASDKSKHLRNGSIVDLVDERVGASADSSVGARNAVGFNFGGGSDNRRHRHLATTRFLLRMYHEESTAYCWQSEWEDRGWCMECENDCSQGEQLWIQFCDDGEDNQYFVYDQVSSTYGRFKPFTKQNLCLEYQASGDLTLETCDSLNSNQIITGFDLKKEFELYPYGRDPSSSNSPLCFTQDHHPKTKEYIEAQTCSSARGDKTSLWFADEVIVEGNPLGVVPSPVYSPVEAPAYSPVGIPTLPLVDNGADSCSPTNPCQRCEGDCNTDSDCAGDMECYHRAVRESVPTCSGGDTIDNRKSCMFVCISLLESRLYSHIYVYCGFEQSGHDFCIPKEFNDRPRVECFGIGVCTSSSPCGRCEGK